MSHTDGQKIKIIQLKQRNGEGDVLNHFPSPDCAKKTGVVMPGKPARYKLSMSSNYMHDRVEHID